MREEVRDRWREEFERLHEKIARSGGGKGKGKGKGEKVVWGLVDGFLLYWDQVSLMSRA